jgi:hypothetical protein
LGLAGAQLFGKGSIWDAQHQAPKIMTILLFPLTNSDGLLKKADSEEIYWGACKILQHGVCQAIFCLPLPQSIPIFQWL